MPAIDSARGPAAADHRPQHRARFRRLSVPGRSPKRRCCRQSRLGLGRILGAPTPSRVTAGRLVLSRARWRLDAAELATTTGNPVAGWAALAGSRGVPGEVFIGDGDNRLTRRHHQPGSDRRGRQSPAWRSTATLRKCCPAGWPPDRRPLRPRTHRAVPAPDRPVAGHPAPEAPQLRRTFAANEMALPRPIPAPRPPTGSSPRRLARYSTSSLRAGTADRWFFLPHRPRPSSAGSDCTAHRRPCARTFYPHSPTHWNPHLDAGTVRKVALDTYDREIEGRRRRRHRVG